MSTDSIAAFRKKWYIPDTASDDNVRQSMSYREMVDGTDRIAAIVGGLLVDESLRATLVVKLPDSASLLEAIFDGPLRSFQSRVTIAERLGIMHHKYARDMRTIGRIRNLFAHKAFLADAAGQSADVSFDSHEVAALCEQLLIPKTWRHVNRDFNELMRCFFTSTCLELLSRMNNDRHGSTGTHLRD